MIEADPAHEMAGPWEEGDWEELIGKEPEGGYEIPSSGDGEEWRRPRVKRRPDMPTTQDIDEHFPLHLNYRSWCAHCVAGRGVSDRHMSGDKSEEPLGVTWHADYAFMKNDEEDGMQPCLIFFDESKNCFWALCVDAKGATPVVAKWFGDKMNDSGYSGEKVTLKSDNEESLVALQKAVAAKRKGETVIINSPVRSSKSNGKMERSVRKWQDQLRTVKHYVESRIKRKIPPESALFTWLATFCAEIISKFLVGKNGRTAYEDITGHRCKHFVIGFAETVHFKLETKKANRQKADSDWDTGIFLGYVWESTEYLVGTKEAIFKCRTIRRVPDEQAYDVNVVDVISIPYNEFISHGAKSDKVEVRFAGQPEANPDAAPIPARGGNEPRRTRLLQSDFILHGYTVDCPGCQCLEADLGERRGHSIQCRQRIEALMKDDAAAQVRLERTTNRHDHYAAAKGEEIMREERDKDPRQEPLVDGPETQKDIVHRLIGDENDGVDDLFGDWGMDDDEMETPNTPLAERPADKKDVRIPSALEKGPSPRRKTATKRKEPMTAAPNEEPDTKKAILWDDSDCDLDNPETGNIDFDDHPDDDIDSLSKGDMSILTEAIMGKTSHTWYGNQALEAAKMDMQLSRVDIAEVFSPARVTALCEKFGLKRGAALDLKSGFDFDKAEDRKKAWDMILSDQPMLIIGSPPCTFFSTLPYLNLHLHRDDPEWLGKFMANLEKAKRHVKFCFEIYQHQREQGRFFLHEHPWLASSWKLDCVEKMERQPDIMKVRTDMCQFGMVSHIESKTQELGPVLKPTGFMTNCSHIARELGVRCDKSHDHVHLVGGRAAAAAIYPDGLCEAICRGLVAQKKQENQNVISSLPISHDVLLSLSTLSREAAVLVEGENDCNYRPKCLERKRRWTEDLVMPNG